MCLVVEWNMMTTIWKYVHKTKGYWKLCKSQLKIAFITVYTTHAKKISLFLSVYCKRLEIKLLTHGFVSSVTQRWIVLAIHFGTSQSASPKRTIHLYHIYLMNLFAELNLGMWSVVVNQAYITYTVDIFHQQLFVHCYFIPHLKSTVTKTT